MLDDPLSRRMVGYVEMYNLPSTVINDKENEQDVEIVGRNDEKVHCRNNISMIPEKGHPGLLLFLVRMVGSEFL